MGRGPARRRSGSFRKTVPFSGKCDAPGRCNRALRRRPNWQASHAPMTLEERGVGEPAVSLTKPFGGRSRAASRANHVGLLRYVEEILASGFPAFRSLSGRARRFQHDFYLRNAVDRDMPEQGLAVRRPDALMAWLRAYAAATSSTAGYSQILDAATPPGRPTSRLVLRRTGTGECWNLYGFSIRCPLGSSAAASSRDSLVLRSITSLIPRSPLVFLA